MRQTLRRYGPGTTLCLAGVVLLLAGASAGVGYVALTSDDGQDAAATREQAAKTGGVELTTVVDLEIPLVPIDPVSANVQPPAASQAALPGFSVDRDVGASQAGLGIDASIDLATGSHRVKDARAGAADVSTSASIMRAIPPAAAPVAIGAAAFTIAGIIAYFWTSIKAWLAAPLVGLYAKISRAEVFDNSVRERIFSAIRANPGLSASDLARLADVSWGTTIYHLDVLEQTRMVSSIRKGRYRRYFENGAALTTSKDTVAVLRNPVTANVVDFLRQNPGVTQKELAGATNMSPQALHWHLARLVETGLVRKEREGRVVRHFIAASAN